MNLSKSTISACVAQYSSGYVAGTKRDPSKKVETSGAFDGYYLEGFQDALAMRKNLGDKEKTEINYVKGDKFPDEDFQNLLWELRGALATVDEKLHIQEAYHAIQRRGGELIELADVNSRRVDHDKLADKVVERLEAREAERAKARFESR